MKTGLPPSLRRRLDVTDFGTPVALITTVPQGDNVHMTIEARGLWEQTVYQSDTQLVIDVKPIKEDPNRLTQGTQGYRGEKLSFNFQNVEVRAALQAIADISGLNIITSDSVTGNLTMRLKEVPWDQALDVVLQAKGLDMRKNGTVLWIAPKEELLTKEKLELEQRAQIADLEPLRSEIFQLNYQKAEAFRTVFGLESGGADSKNRVLSKRGSAIIDAAHQPAVRHRHRLEDRRHPQADPEDRRRLQAGADRGAPGRGERQLQPQPRRQARLRRHAHHARRRFRLPGQRQQPRRRRRQHDRRRPDHRPGRRTPPIRSTTPSSSTCRPPRSAPCRRPRSRSACSRPPPTASSTWNCRRSKRTARARSFPARAW